jgi:hypothetical protein
MPVPDDTAARTGESRGPPDAKEDGMEHFLKELETLSNDER